MRPPESGIVDQGQNPPKPPEFAFKRR